MEARNDKDIGKLNDFLQNEIAAVETYGQCIEKTKTATMPFVAVFSLALI